MKKYFGWILSAMTCLTMFAAYADETKDSDKDKEVVILPIEEGESK